MLVGAPAADWASALFHTRPFPFLITFRVVSDYAMAISPNLASVICQRSQGWSRVFTARPL